MVKNAQRTVYAINLQLAQMLGKSYHVKANTTLNEKFALNTTLGELGVGNYPTLKYWCIGTGGDHIPVTANGFSFSQHSAADAALFNQVPFVLRRMTDDLGVADRAKYRLRKEVAFNSVPYVAYYLKVIDEMEFRDQFFKVTKNGNTSILSPYSTLDESLLNPVARNKEGILKNVGTNQYLAVLAKIAIRFTGDDIKELKNVFKILNVEYNTLTELALCTGVEAKSLDGNMEATAVQIAYHVGCSIDLTTAFSTEEPILRYVEIGGAESYYLK